jgi:hypothetical protein
MSKRTKVKTKISHIEAHDECGNLVFFELPFAAVHYDQHYVRLKDQDRIDDTMDELIELFYAQNEN